MAPTVQGSPAGVSQGRRYAPLPVRSDWLQPVNGYRGGGAARTISGNHDVAHRGCSFCARNDARIDGSASWSVAADGLVVRRNSWSDLIALVGFARGTGSGR